MNFHDYQEQARAKAVYPELGGKVVFPTLGMVGEAGEVADKVKKLFRDHEGVITDEAKQELAKELGDVLWYLSQVATELDLSLEAIAEANIEKINSRHDRDAVHGSGDNR